MKEIWITECNPLSTYINILLLDLNFWPFLNSKCVKVDFTFFKSWCLKCPLIWIKWVAILRSRSTTKWFLNDLTLQSSKAHITLLYDKRHKHLFCDTVLFFWCPQNSNLHHKSWNLWTTYRYWSKFVTVLKI